jgi:hypothetical protein
MPYFDLRDNFPNIFSELKAMYYEGLESYRIPSSISWTRRKSRTSVQRTAKKQAAQRKKWILENSLNKILPDKDKTLVIRFVGNRQIGYLAKTNQGIFGVLFLSWNSLWVAGFQDNQGRIRATQESCISHTDCLARLCGQPWALHKFSDTELSLYDIYESVYFDFSDSNRKKPRNNTLKLRVDSILTPIWL